MSSISKLFRNVRSWIQGQFSPGVKCKYEAQDRQLIAPAYSGNYAETSDLRPLAFHIFINSEGFSDSIVKCLQKVPMNFDIFISCSGGMDASSIIKPLADFKKLRHVSYQTIEEHQLQQYSHHCFVYEPLQSSSAYDKIIWKEMLASWLADTDSIYHALELLEQNTCGLVYPDLHYTCINAGLSVQNWMKQADASEWCRKHLHQPINPDALYPAHGLFWMSGNFLQQILNDVEFSHKDFLRQVAYLSLDKGRFNYILPGIGSEFFGKQLLIHRYYDLMLQLFDRDFYLENNPDVKACGIDPFEHYQRFGRFESRIPCGRVPMSVLQQHPEYHSLIQQKDDNFDAQFYLRTYLPAAMAFLLHNIHPQQHFQLFGKEYGFLTSIEKLHEIQKSGKASKLRYSIIIPVYNSEDYLADCLESAYNQTAENVEVVIVNDGSPDNSHEIIEKYRTKYPHQTKVITHEQNKGLVCTHRDGIAAATGDYFTILDGDDWLDPGFCVAMAELALAYDAECVSCGWTRPKAYTKPVQQDTTPLDIRVLEKESKIDSVVHWSGYPNIHYGLNRKLYHLESWKKINPINCKESILYFEDSVVTLRYMVECSKVVIIRNPLYHWFDNSASIGNKLIDSRYVTDIFDVIENLSFLSQSDAHSAVLYARNIDNIFLSEFLKRIQEKATRDTPDNVMSIIELFAERFDKCSYLFSQEQKDTIIEKLMSLYYQSCRKCIGKQKPENFVLFVDPVGITHLKEFYLEYWEAHTDVPYKYIQCSAKCPLSERLEKMRLGASCLCVVTTGGWSISEFHTCRPIVQMWHGMGALKKVASHPRALQPQLAFCSSKDVIPVYAELFGCPKKSVLPLGSIVADAYNDLTKLQQVQEDFYERYPNCKGKKIYLWCPTFRGKAPHIYLQDHLDFETLSAQLTDDEFLLAKYHPAIGGLTNNDSKDIQHENIIDVTSENLYQVLSVADVFMTDYSSALHCAMLRDIPVCFLVTDEATYVKAQGLLIDYNHLPGPKCTDTKVENILFALRSAKADTRSYREFKNYHIGACKGTARRDMTKAVLSFIKA